jgi:hypothetical protein
MRADGATYAQIKKALRVGSDTVGQLLGTVGTGKSRPRLSQEQRAKARELREEGWSVPEISKELGIGKTTAFELTKGIRYEVSPEGVARRRAAVAPRTYGCLTIYVTMSAAEYRRMEGFWRGIAAAAGS